MCNVLHHSNYNLMNRMKCFQPLTYPTVIANNMKAGDFSC